MESTELLDNTLASRKQRSSKVAYAMHLDISHMKIYALKHLFEHKTCNDGTCSFQGKVARLSKQRLIQQEIHMLLTKLSL